jgi:16S rRNA A1518/A1519 N6-dimethyltransferase RsmA/KsgA/DIM1 with predicted DNA glycosylase/AP lyase activity
MGDAVPFLTQENPELQTLVLKNQESSNIHLTGNLPFSIATDLLLKLIQSQYDQQGLFAHQTNVGFTFIFQEEVAQRLIALPSTSHRSRLSVLCQCLYDVKWCTLVPKSVFYPQPSINGAIIQFIPKLNASRLLKNLSFHEWQTFLSIAFQQRRKTLINNLKVAYSTTEIVNVFDSLQIPVQMRAQELSNEQLLQVAQFLQKKDLKH